MYIMYIFLLSFQWCTMPFAIHNHNSDYKTVSVTNLVNLENENKSPPLGGVQPIILQIRPWIIIYDIIHNYCVVVSFNVDGFCLVVIKLTVP